MMLTPKNGERPDTAALLAEAVEDGEQKPDKMKALKDKYELGKKFYDISGELLTYKRDDLADEEKEANKPNRYRQVKWVAWFFFILYIIIVVLSPTLDKIGQEKSKITSMEKKQNIQFDMNSPGGLGQLLPVHHFAYFDRYSIIDRVECIKNKHPRACFGFAIKECQNAIVDLKSTGYIECMHK